VCTVSDVLRLIHPEEDARSARRHAPRSAPARAHPEFLLTLPPHERALYRALRERPRPMDELAEVSGLTAAQLGVALLSLELQGLARRDPGGLARRVRRS